MRAPLIARAFASSARAPSSRRGASSSILAALLERTPLRALVDDVARDDDDDGANANDANANDDDDANASAYRASLPTVVVRGVRGKTPMTEHVARTIASLRRAPVVLTPSSSRAVDERGLLGRRLADVPRVSVRVGTTARALAMACDDARRVAASTATATATASTSAAEEDAARRTLAFDRDARFAGDVDVDDVELRCVEERWRRGGGGGGGGDDDAAAEPEPEPEPAAAAAYVIDGGGGGVDATLEVLVVDALAGAAAAADDENAPKAAAAVARADVVALLHANLVDPPTLAAFVDSRVKPLLKNDGVLIVRARMRPEKIERLARYAGESPRHEWTPPLSRLRGSKVLCVESDGADAGEALRACLESLVAPAVDDDKNGYGLRLRDTGEVEAAPVGGGDGDADADAFFTEATLERVVRRYREMHAVSGNVGGAEARLVLTEKDVAKLRGLGARGMRGACAVLAACDPLVLSSRLVVDDDDECDAFRDRVEAALLSVPQTRYH